MNRMATLTAVTLVGVATSAASAGPIQYTMTWNSVYGMYGSTAVSGARLTLTFDYDTDDVFFDTIGRGVAVFTNGAGIRATLVNDASGTPSTILSDVALDNDAANSSGLLANGARIYFGKSFDGTSYGTDRGSIGSFATTVSAGDALITTWSSIASSGTISGPWSNYPLKISGLDLTVNLSTNTSGGSWGSVMGSTPAVPGVGGVAALAGVGLAGRRRRR